MASTMHLIPTSPVSRRPGLAREERRAGLFRLGWALYCTVHCCTSVCSSGFRSARIRFLDFWPVRAECVTCQLTCGAYLGLSGEIWHSSGVLASVPSRPTSSGNLHEDSFHSNWADSAMLSFHRANPDANCGMLLLAAPISCWATCSVEQYPDLSQGLTGLSL